MTKEVKNFNAELWGIAIVTDILRATRDAHLIAEAADYDRAVGEPPAGSGPEPRRARQQKHGLAASSACAEDDLPDLVASDDNEVADLAKEVSKTTVTGSNA